MARKHTDEVLLTVGYHDKIAKKNKDEQGVGDLYNELMSVGSQPNFNDVKQELDKVKRANSITKFKWSKWKNRMKYNKKISSIATSSIRASSIESSEISGSDSEKKRDKE